MFLTSMKAIILSLSEKSSLFFRRLDKQISEFIKSTGTVWGLIIALWAIAIYLMINFFLPNRVSPEHFLYFYQPILWISLAILAWLGWRYGLVERPKPALALSYTTALFALFQIAALLIAGLLLGFGYSPYIHELNGVLRNLLYLVTLLTGLEMTRAYLVTRFKESHPWIGFMLVSFFLSLLRLSPATFGQLDTLQLSMQTIGERLLPTLAQNMLATLLAMLGGPLVSLIYLGILHSFEWLSPILPNPGWFVTAFIGTIIPAYSMVIVYNQFIAESEETEEAEPATEEQAKIQGRGDFTSWALVSLFTLILVGFSTGLFGVHPSLIGSGSMDPNLTVGDIVVAREIPVEDIKIGDVITFYQNGVTIVHRVIDIQKDGGKTVFITKGDANDSPDSPVLEKYYRGKVIFFIPKIGWISIRVRNALVRIL